MDVWTVLKVLGVWLVVLGLTAWVWATWFRQQRDSE